MYSCFPFFPHVFFLLHVDALLPRLCCHRRTFSVPSPHISHHRPAQSSVGAWSAPPQQGVVGGPPASISSGPPGVAGPTGFPVGGYGLPDPQGTASYCPPAGRSLDGPSTSSGPQRDLGAGPTVDALHVPAVGADGAEDADVESVFDGDGEFEPSAASSASAVIPDDIVAAWEAHGPLALSPSSASRRRLKKWIREDTSFSLPRPDHCLHSPFEAFKKSSKASWEAASLLTSSSGAAGHAVITASARVERLKSWVESHASSPDAEGYWRPFVDALSEILSPLDDAADILASSFARGVQAVRKGVIAAAPAPLRSILSSRPPSGGFFFGNPTQELTAAMNFQVMATQMAQSSTPRHAAPPRRPPPRAAATSSRPSASAPSSSAASSSAKGKAGGRPARGGKGGQKK